MDNCGKPKTICAISLAVVFVVTIGLSFSALEYTELGLNYSWITSSVEDRGYTAGLYVLGPGNSFLKFPSTVQSIQFSHDRESAGPPLRSRTSDGLEVALEVSFQYQLSAKNLFAIYMKYGMAYEIIYVNMAMDLITRMATRYSANQFFSNRTTISEGMERNMLSLFAKEAYASVPFFQLRAVSLPSAFEQEIEKTEVKKQDIQIAQAEFDNQEVQMKTKVLQAQQQAKSIGIQANASAQATLLNTQAYVEQFKLTQSLQAEALVPLFTKFKKNETLLMEYLRTRVLRDHPNHLTVVSMPVP